MRAVDGRIIRINVFGYFHIIDFRIISLYIYVFVCFHLNIEHLAFLGVWGMVSKPVKK